jgi:hypothetical protein
MRISKADSTVVPYKHRVNYGTAARSGPRSVESFCRAGTIVHNRSCVFYSNFEARPAGVESGARPC